MKICKKFLILLALFSLVLMFFGLVFAQSGVVGVSEGDWFSYEFYFDWYSDDENITIPKDISFDYILEGESVRFEVFEVLGSNITGQFAINYKNGTEETVEGWVDVVTGEGELSNWIISSGLVANDLTYQSGIGEIINETTMFQTQLGIRETNHIEYSFENTTESNYYMLGVNMYWDKEIGILVEMSFESEMIANGKLTSASGGWKLTESNIETIPEFSLLVLIGTFIAASVVGFLIRKLLG